jgi:hypothetical protein
VAPANQSRVVMTDPDGNEFCVLRSLVPGHFSICRSHAVCGRSVCADAHTTLQIRVQVDPRGRNLTAGGGVISVAFMRCAAKYSASFSLCSSCSHWRAR